VTVTRPVSKRIAAVLVPLCLAAACVAGSATARASSLRFSFLPARALQGGDVAVRVAVRPRSARCSLVVRYQGGGVQSGLAAVRAKNGVAEWRWTVPLDTQAGLARVTASCGGAGRITGKVLVVGQLIPVKVDVVKRGFSIRPLPYSGTSVSYGLILHNESKNQDAMNVNVLVNFVMADNKLLGSESTSITQISAGADYALGDELTFPGAAPIDRLEVVVQVGSHALQGTLPPATANLRVLPDPYDPGWVGSVEGELINDKPNLSLWNARLSAVVFDAAGNILGGGSGYAFQALPPGTREFIKITSGLKAIPITLAASAVVSIDATWRQPGT
jgi:hypothetical protein